jgi:hypothetical protein
MGQTEISGRCYRLMHKNGEDFVVDFACVKCHRVGILHNLTDIRRNTSAVFGLRVARVPVAYQWSQIKQNSWSSYKIIYWKVEIVGIVELNASSSYINNPVEIHTLSVH